MTPLMISLCFHTLAAYPVMRMSYEVGSDARTHPPMAGHSMVLKCSWGGGLVMLTSWRDS